MKTNIEQIAETDYIDNQNYYNEQLKQCKSKEEFINNTIYEIGAEYDLDENQANSVMENIYKLACKHNNKKTEALSDTNSNNATIKTIYNELNDKTTVPDVEGLVDDILVVTDPNINGQEYNELIDRAKEIIEDTPEGQIPSDPSFLGQYAQRCPICGSTFIADHIYESGAECPVCYDTPEAFVVIGQLQSDEQVGIQNGIKPEEDETIDTDTTPAKDTEMDKDIDEMDLPEDDNEDNEDKLEASEQIKTSISKLQESKPLYSVTTEDKDGGDIQLGIYNIKDDTVEFGYSNGEGPYESKIYFNKNGDGCFVDEQGYEWTLDEFDVPPELYDSTRGPKARETIQNMLDKNYKEYEAL